MKSSIFLIGHPLEHSVSPAMHNAACGHLGIAAEYFPLDVAPADLERAVLKLRGPEVLGFNVTIPYKEKIMEYLDDIAELAKTIGAVNTVKNEGGTLVGYNTDAPGFIESLKDEAGFLPTGKKVVILGAGGASRAVATILAKESASEIVITDVIPQKANELAEYVRQNFGVQAKALESDDPLIQKHISEASLLVNTTPLGMIPKVDQCPLSDDIELHAGLTVYDLVYNPKETQLLKRAKAAQANALSGLGMLVRQGALAFEIFTGCEAPYAVMRKAAGENLAT